ncbi:hypothetical protein GGI42DRAFT_331826 [Trichoderma sp. SZMC 28013]
MQAGKNEIIVHAWAVEETPWTYEPSQQIEVGNDQSSLSKVIAACVSTASMNIAITQLSRKPVNESYGNTLQYPMCDSWILKTSESLPLFMGQPTRCEIYFLLVTIITCLHWSCIFSLFNQPRWKNKYLFNIVAATLITLLPLATITRDSTAVFLQFLPIVTDVYILGAVIMDYVRDREPRLRNVA